MNTLTLLHPDDWHLHLRDGSALAAVLPHTVARFARAIVMPNLRPPVVTLSQALDYQQRILAALPAGVSFTPLMTLYLTDRTDPDEIYRAKDSGLIHGVKLYPAGATTHSEAGVTALERVYPVLAALEHCGLPLLVHGEVTDPSVDVFAREKVFLDRQLAPLLERFPQLKVVLEHLTTADGVRFVEQGGNKIAGTITPQHLLLNRNALFQGGLRPHHYCLPVLKREHHRLAVLAAAVSGHPRFFLGTDSAPHPLSCKHSSCGCAGIYSAHAALELYAEAFEQVGALDRLEAFASHHGPDFYGLPRNQRTITLVRQPWTVPSHYPFGEESSVVPLRAGETVAWQLVSEASQHGKKI